MTKFYLLFCCCFSLSASAQFNWKKVEVPGSQRILQSFRQPETAYANTVTWGWNGPMNERVIRQDLDSLYHMGFRAVTIEAGYDMPVAYLSDGWFKLIQTAVTVAKEKGMRIWIIDEGKYPSGFAGGKFSAERPDLRMQGLVVADKISVSSGAELHRKLSPAIVSAVAINLTDSSNIILDISSGNLSWTGTAGNWQIVLVQHQFKTAVTRAVNNPGGGKDTTNSLCDYLSPVAVQQFLDFTHEQYKRYIGAEFGKTVLGFRGDEPDFAYMPWTANIPQEFRERKGYDIQPFLASFFLPKLTTEQQKAKADYWDVWSDLFAEHFFKLQADWCEKNKLEYMVHLNHDHEMLSLVKSEGDFFKDLRDVHIPGIDVIWNQIWPGKVADFPKFASSSAHLNGHPRALSESFAAFNPAADVEQARWIINHQLVRGINLFELMFFPSTSTAKGGAKSYMADKMFPTLMAYTNRASFVLSLGRPAAEVAVYFATPSLWLGNKQTEKSTFEIAQRLLENQRDFDFIDDYSIIHADGPENGQIKNKSGQFYTAVIIPDVSTLSKTVLDKLTLFAKNGGKVIFAGQLPKHIWNRSFLQSYDFRAAEHGPFVYESVAEKWIKILPAADFHLDLPAPSLKYLHRKWADADAYFIFNESDKELKRKVSLRAEGTLANWNLQDGQVKMLKGVVKKESTNGGGQGIIQFELLIKPYGSALIVGGRHTASQSY